ncbi:WD repeat-containing protein mio [Pitangus sulphuratus]|nr:WD repeat-containing protein mio [Pitangus sulphuratus]
MSGSKPDILWAPHHVDRFVVCDSELSLYHIDSAVSSELKAGSLRLSEETTATLLSINSDTPYMKCVAWYPKYDPECLLAVGQANGRVVLTSLGQDHNSKSKDLIGKEFVPKHARQCNTLAWNPLDSNWLAAGLDKHRADFSVLIWDISSKYAPETAVATEKVRLSAGDAESGLVVTKPLYELGQNDACLSLCWLPRDQKLLLAGMHRNLAIFDLRNTSQKIFVNTKAVQGVTVDPYFHDRVASFYEGQVAIWDLRKFEKPVLTLTEQPKPLTKVAWCPTRTGLLATLTRDSNIIRLYDMQHTPTPIGDETEPTIIERSVQPCENYIASFAWHPTSQNRMVVVTPNRTMSDFTVFERISLAWSPVTSLMWACGRHLYECTEEGKASSLEKDIATKMRLRALSRVAVYDGKVKTLEPGDGSGFVLFICQYSSYSSAFHLCSLLNEKDYLATKVGDLNLNVVAMALSGYTDEKNSLWREMCSTLRLQLNNPYLCAMFAFLTSESGSYDGVLYENNVAVRDRVAFACKFLNDAQLNRFIEKLTNEMKEAGNLEGILLTGLTKDGVDLMESYVDRTGDVQTASYCMLQGSPSDVLKDERVQYWIENYRNLLDAWRFWHKRAEFDIHRSKLDPSSKPLAQVFVSCNFCGKSISYSCSAIPHQGRGFSQYGVSGSPTKSKVTSCPGCRGSKSDEKVDLSKDKKLAQFSNWFTWCHNCRHGGHAGHMLSWFRFLPFTSLMSSQRSHQLFTPSITGPAAGPAFGDILLWCYFTYWKKSSELKMNLL